MHGYKYEANFAQTGTKNFPHKCHALNSLIQLLYSTIIHSNLYLFIQKQVEADILNDLHL